jgi:Domain of unknown function (DUF6458)
MRRGARRYVLCLFRSLVRGASRAYPEPAIERFIGVATRRLNTLEGGFMGIGVSLFLIAVGAVLAFAVNATSDAVNVNTVGWILMGVGAAGALLSMIFWSSWGGPGYVTRRRATYVDEGPPTY